MKNEFFLDTDLFIDDGVVEEGNKTLATEDMAAIYSFISSHSFEESYRLIDYLWEKGDPLYNLQYADSIYNGCYNDMFYGRKISYNDILKIRKSFESVIQQQDSLGCLQFLSWFLEKSQIHQGVMVNGKTVEKDFGYEILGSFKDLVFKANMVVLNDKYPEYVIFCNEIMEQLPDWVEEDSIDKKLVLERK